MTEIMMALGEYRFSLPTAAYQSLEKTSEWRWQEQDRLGRKPALQYTGPGSTKINMSGTIYPHYQGGLDQVGKMKAEADRGEPLGLVDGLGRVWGDFCIKQISETATKFDVQGIPRKIEFRLSLIEYGEDE